MAVPDHTRVRTVTVHEEQAGQRIGNFLLRELKGVPKSRIYRLMRKGEVRVNKGRVKPEYRLQTGDQVRIPPVRVAVRDKGTPSSNTVSRVAEAVIFENDRLLVIDKPSGVAVHGGSGISHGVIEALRAARPNAPFLELVHRLDRETSGCLVIAKRRSALRHLHEVIRNGEMEKRYLALVKGPWLGDQVVDAPLRKNQLRGGERIVTVEPDGKPSRTRFRLVSGYGKRAALVEAELETGRTHQIRVHGAHIGHPLAGDEKYGDEAFNRAMKEQGLRRLFLHAHSLRFPAPGDDDEILVNAPLSDELRAVLDRLESGSAGGTAAG